MRGKFEDETKILGLTYLENTHCQIQKKKLHNNAAVLAELGKIVLHHLLDLVPLLLLLRLLLILGLRLVPLLWLLLILLAAVLLTPVMRLLVALAAGGMVPPLVASGLRGQRRRGAHLAARQVDIHAALVLLGRVVQPHLLADLLDARLDLLDVPGAVVALADDHMQMRLAPGLGVADARLQDVLGLLDELAVEIDRVVGDPALHIVLAEDVFRRLLVVLVLLGLVLLSLVGQSLGLGAIAALVRLVRLKVVQRQLPGIICFQDNARGEKTSKHGKGAFSGVNRTRSKQELLFAASWRARSRRRSYSASESLLAWWLKALTHLISGQSLRRRRILAILRGMRGAWERVTYLDRLSVSWELRSPSCRIGPNERYTRANGSGKGSVGEDCGSETEDNETFPKLYMALWLPGAVRRQFCPF